MSKTHHRFRRAWRLSFLLLLASLSLAPAARGAEILPPGFRPVPLGSHALVGGKVIIKPGEVLDSGTILIRDGLIKAVGKDVAAPPDARIWDMKGTVIYAGFIDPYLVVSGTNAPISTTDSEPVTSSSLTAGGINFFGSPGQAADRGKAGPGYEVARVTPDYRAAREYAPNEKTLAPMREMGFTAGVVAPSKGIIRGTSTLVALSEENPNDLIIKPDVFQHISFETRQSEERAYPGSLMGVIATVRQSFFDAEHYALDYANYQKNPHGRKRPEFDPALEALAPAAGKKMMVAFEPGSALMVERAARVARELGLDFCIVSSGQEWRRPDLAKAAGGTLMVPLNYPTLPKLPNDDDWDQITLDELRGWDWAPETQRCCASRGSKSLSRRMGWPTRKNSNQTCASPSIAASPRWMHWPR